MRSLVSDMEYRGTSGPECCKQLNDMSALLRTFATQVEALKKYRSKGEQHCTVEHVHVHSGGQAVVGAVTARGPDRGEGNNGNGDQ